MENLEANGQETSTFKTISTSVGIGCNCSSKGSENLSYNMVSTCPGPFGRSSFAEAKKRLKKLERDYQHTYEKYKELQDHDLYGESNCYSYYVNVILQSPGHHCRWVSYCINHSKDLVDRLQNVLDKLNTEEALQRGKETPTNGKQFFLMHGCKSLAQEKMVLQRLKAENKEQYTDGLNQETIDVQTFRYTQRIIPQSSSKKPIHDLVRRVKEVQKLTEKAISNGALMGNRTSLDDLKSSTSVKIKLLTQAIRELEKERKETENILQDRVDFARKNVEKKRVLQEKIKCIAEKRDAEKKYLLDLTKDFMASQKTPSQIKDVTSISSKTT